MSVFTCGDTHGRPYDTSKLNGDNWPEQKQLTKDDVLVQLGDFGWVWYEFGLNKEQEHWLDWLAGKKYTLAVVPGNHENYDIIENLPIIEKWGAPVRVLKRKTGEIYFLERGYVYTICGKTIFVFGGAKSNKRPDNYIPPKGTYSAGYRVDKKLIVEGVDWWARELPSEDEYERGRNSLEEHNWKVDWMFCHTCPTSVVKELNSYAEAELGKQFDSDNECRTNDPVSIYLEELCSKTEFNYFCFGHFHLDWSIDLNAKRYMCFFKDKPLDMNDFDEL